MWKVAGKLTLLSLLVVTAILGSQSLQYENSVDGQALTAVTSSPYLETVSPKPLTNTTYLTTSSQNIDARFSGMLLHLKWLMKQEGGGVSKDLFDKQIDSLSDNLGDDIDDLQSEIDDIDSSILDTDSLTPDMVLAASQTDEYCLTYEATGDTWEWQTCGSGSSGLATTSIDTSTELAAILTDETGTGALVFAGSPTLTGTLSAANANFSGNVGIGSTSPSAKLTVQNTGSGNSFIVEDQAGDSTPFVIDASGNLGIGRLADSSRKLWVDKTSTVTSGYDTNASFWSVANPSSNSSAAYVGVETFVHTQSGNSSNLTNQLTGTYSEADHEGTGTVALQSALYGFNGNYSTGTVTDSSVVRAEVFNVAAGTITDMKVFNAAYFGNFGTITNTYGLYLGDLTSGTQTNQAYSIYASDANTRNYFAGNVGIGTTSPYAKLSVTGNSAFTGQLNLTGTAANIALGSNWLSGDGGDEGLFVSSAGGVSIGAAPNNDSIFNVNRTVTAASGNRMNVNFSLDIDPLSSGNVGYDGIYNTVGTLSSSTNDITGWGYIRGAANSAYHSGSGTVANVIGASNNASNFGSGTITDMFGTKVYLYNDSAAGSIVNSYGSYLSSPYVGGGSWQNAYGLYVEDHSGITSNLDFNIYSAGANSTNYFAGNVGIGTSSPLTTLQVNGELLIGSNVNPASFSFSKLSVYNANPSDGFSTITVAAKESGGYTGSSVDFNWVSSANTAHRIFQVGGEVTNTADAANNHDFFISDISSGISNTRLLINAAGNTGIGSTSPSAKLTVQNTGSGNSFIVEDQAGDSTPFVVTNDGRVGIGTATPNSGYLLDVQKTSTGVGSDWGMRMNITVDPSAATGYHGAGDFYAHTQSGNNFNVSGLYGVDAEAYHSGTGAISTAFGVQGLVANYSTGSITDAYAVTAAAYNSNAAGTISNLKLFDVSYFSNSGTITNTYGLYLGDLTAGTQTNQAYSIYASDANTRNYFAGNVGIGTTTPRALLHVQGDSGIMVSKNNDALTFYSNGNGTVEIDAVSPDNNEMRHLYIGANAFSVYTGEQDWSNSATRFTITETGNVGIGTTTPAFNLQVLGNSGVYKGITGNGIIASEFGVGVASVVQADAAGNYGLVQVGAGNNQYALWQSFVKTRSTNGNTFAAVQNGDELGHFRFFGDTGAEIYPGADIIVQVDGTPSGTSMPGKISFATTPAGSVIPVERLTISNSGSTGIGTTTPAQKLQVYGNIRVGTTGFAGCLEDFSGTLIAGTCSSDERLKEDIEALASSTPRSYLEALTALTPVTYHWNEAAVSGYQKSGEVLNIGLIAQDVEAQFPELVSIDDEGYRQVDFRAFPFYIIQALKELWVKVEGLIESDEEQDDRIRELEERILQLEAEHGGSSYAPPEPPADPGTSEEPAPEPPAPPVEEPPAEPVETPAEPPLASEGGV